MEKFYALLKKTGYPQPAKTVPLPQSGSARKYYRFFFSDDKTLIGSYNPEIKENKAHYVFTKHFVAAGLPVPDILAQDESGQYFLLEDLGDDTLLALKNKEGLSEKIKGFYYQAMDDLIAFQVKGIEGLDLSVAYPARCFDKRSILWDLNYFKYFFVKTNVITFDENLLEDDFERFAGLLLQADASFFMYRDFQARNIMVKEDSLWYIDFQGGRQGPLQYDVISLLYQAKANLPDTFRQDLLAFYLNKLEEVLPGQRERFLEHYRYFIFFRLMQVLGAYGYRGLFQRKAHFLQSIPFTIDTLKNLMQENELQAFPEINRVFRQILKLNYQKVNLDAQRLNVTVTSFSYKKSGIPADVTENGGGFVFDCRALPNPGRIESLKRFTGKDKVIIDYLSSQKEVSEFLNHVFALVDRSVDNYLERQFNHLMVNFGCTGGQHRSVYSAENLKKHLQEKYGEQIVVHLKHVELEKKGDA